MTVDKLLPENKILIELRDAYKDASCKMPEGEFWLGLQFAARHFAKAQPAAQKTEGAGEMTLEEISWAVNELYIWMRHTEPDANIMPQEKKDRVIKAVFNLRKYAALASRASVDVWKPIDDNARSGIPVMVKDSVNTSTFIFKAVFKDGYWWQANNMGDTMKEWGQCGTPELYCEIPPLPAAKFPELVGGRE